MFTAESDLPSTSVYSYSVQRNIYNYYTDLIDKTILIEWYNHIFYIYYIGNKYLLK